MKTNPLNAELNPMCHLLALLGAHPILHVSRIRANLNLWLYLAHFFLDWDMFQAKSVQKIETNILRSVSVFFFLIRAIYAIKWKNIAEQGRSQMTV